MLILKPLSFCVIIFFNIQSYSQSLSQHESQLFQHNKLFTYFLNPEIEKIRKEKIKFYLSFNYHTIFNSGHANLDNNAEIYTTGRFSSLRSFRFSYRSNWLVVDLEPFQKYNSDFFSSSPTVGASMNTNNHINNNYFRKNSSGLRQSQITLHYKGLGVGLARKSHWWGPGFHSAISMSTNAPSQNTLMFGTFKEVDVKRLSLFAKIIAIPYKNYLYEDIYFSGIKAYFRYNSDPQITFGFHRTYLSGDFDSSLLTTQLNGSWGLKDALSLVFEPLYGQSKKGLSYTNIGTQGFDRWDEILTGFIKIKFPSEDLEFYLDVASDDNRANFTDLRSHWDHTLGYQIGFKKNQKINNINLFIGSEITSLIESNTFKDSFFRGKPNIANYYAKPEYDYFTYEGRLLGAHSGSSSDDLILVVGASFNKLASFVSINKERHAVKAEEYPEDKFEVSLATLYYLSEKQSIFINMEYEKIKNFSYVENKISNSWVLWAGYTFSLGR